MGVFHLYLSGLLNTCSRKSNSDLMALEMNILVLDLYRSFMSLERKYFSFKSASVLFGLDLKMDIIFDICFSLF